MCVCGGINFSGNFKPMNTKVSLVRPRPQAEKDTDVTSTVPLVVMPLTSAHATASSIFSGTSRLQIFFLDLERLALFYRLDFDLISPSICTQHLCQSMYVILPCAPPMYPSSHCFCPSSFGALAILPRRHVSSQHSNTHTLLRGSL